MNEKPLYTDWQNIKYTVSNLWKWDKPLLFFITMQAPVSVLLTLSGLYVVRLVISLIENNVEAGAFIIQVTLFSTGMLIFNIINNSLSAKIRWRRVFIRLTYSNMINHKVMDADYDIVENPKVMDKMQKAYQTVLYIEGSATEEIIMAMIDTCTNVINILFLFGIISMLNPFLLLAITLLTLIQYFFNRSGHRWSYHNAEKWAVFDRKLGHINHVSGDFSRAKDIRLYGLHVWLNDVFENVLHNRIEWLRKQEKALFGYYDVNQAVIQLILCNGITFVYIINHVAAGNISIADAVFYLTAIGTLSGVIMGVINSISKVHSTSLSVCHLREFLEIPDISNRGEGIALPSQAMEIEFDNVSFIYPNSDKEVLSHLSFKIKKGEKIAVVGLNGAGKTTMVKLICGLYHPSGGKIKINGHELSEYNRDEYYSLISAVFQESYLCPVSIKQNIALCEEKDIDYAKLNQVIRSAGLLDKIESLPEGADTFLLKGVHENAIELSGGEMQKLSLARALYKDGSLLILDEPTSALDPIAENEMYLKYNEFSKNKTAVFISHRLSSTRFCDRIFLLECGNIVEIGHHDELMTQNGKYAELFNIQSHYYKEGGQENENA